MPEDVTGTMFRNVSLINDLFHSFLKHRFVYIRPALNFWL